MIERFSVTLRLDDHDELGELMLHGEFDYSTARGVLDTAASALSDDSLRRLVVDLTDVTFIDSSGIGALVKIYRMGLESGCSTALRDPSPATAAILKLTSVDRLFTDNA